MLAKDPAAKALIFSQFTSMLDLVAFRLDQARGSAVDALIFSFAVHVHARLVAFNLSPAHLTPSCVDACVDQRSVQPIAKVLVFRIFMSRARSFCLVP